MDIIKIAKDFSTTPSGRLKSKGPYSGEEFKNTLLIPKFKTALKAHNKLTVDLDGGYGYAPSFLEEAFGGLSVEFGKEIVLEHLLIITEDEPSLNEDIKKYINKASDARK